MAKGIGLLIGGTICGLGLFCVYDYIKTCKRIKEMEDEIDAEFNEFDQFLDDQIALQNEINAKLDEFAQRFNSMNYDQQQEALLLHFKETRK